MEKPGEKALERLLEFAGTICGIVLLLRLAWAMIQPILPGLIVISVLAAAAVVAVAWYRRSW